MQVVQNVIAQNYEFSENLPAELYSNRYMVKLQGVTGTRSDNFNKSWDIGVVWE